MMHRISLSPFAGYIPIFDLQGCVDPGEPGGEPCRVKVGPRRFLDITVLPDHFKADIWSNKNGPICYLVGLPIPEQRDKQGRRLFDAVDFLQQHIGESHPCPVEQFQRGKRLGIWSNTFLATEYGAATAHSYWLDIWVFDSELRLAPGTLTVCGQEVQSISWESFSQTTSASGEVLRPLVETLLHGPHQLDIGEIIRQVPSLYRADGLNLLELNIQTNFGSYCMEYSWEGSSISVSLSDGGSASCCTVRTGMPDVLEVLLYLMQANTREALERKLAKMSILGMVTTGDEA